MECTHLLDNIKADIIVEDTPITKNFNCSECAATEQNWLCLQCGAIGCGRYVNGHAKHHAETFDHQLCMSCEAYSVYCYKCDDYVSNDSENETLCKIRQSVKRVNEHYNGDPNSGAESNGDLSKEAEQSESHNSPKSSTSLQNEKPVSPPELVNTAENGQENLGIDSGPCSSLSDLPNAFTDISEQTDTKPIKVTKVVDEPVRTLRLRSRKRSHSEDRGAAENLPQPSKAKEKKASPCNGKTQREKKIVGLKNLGNTCFMNAVLQSLNNIQEFSCYFSQLPSLETKSNGKKVYHSRSYTRQEVHEVVMAEELRKVLINLNTGGCGSKGAISPECLFLAIWKVVPRFRGYQQQDAHEFLLYMLDRLHTELLQLLPPERAESSVGPRTASASIVTDVFGGTLQSEVRCLACGAQSGRLDPFLDLSLQLPDARHDAPVALHDCLASFVQVEELADKERYFCSSCKCKQKSTIQFWIRRLPNVLCLHLKRFRWHNYFRSKVDTTISFPLSALDMSRFVTTGDTRRSPRAPRSPPAPRTSSLYDLAAVVVHHGSGAGSGHYTAFAINEEQWFHFNDQTVRATDANAVASCKPYILFYIRREPTLPSAS